jgi:hypothetical protein
MRQPCVCRFKMLAAKLSKIAKASHTNQFDKGPAANRKDSVQPKLLVRFQTARAYTKKTAGPIKSDKSAAKRCAKSPAQVPVRLRKSVITGSTLPTHGRADSACTATAVVLISDINWPLLLFPMHAKGRKFPAPPANHPHAITRIPNPSWITRRKLSEKFSRLPENLFAPFSPIHIYVLRELEIQISQRGFLPVIRNCLVTGPAAGTGRPEPAIPASGRTGPR